MFRRWIFLLVFSTLILAACQSKATSAPSTTSTEVPQAETASASADGLTRIRLPMGYIPNIQFAPFYMAQDRGYFREAGFEVEFDYSFETDGVALVGAGEIPFAVVSGEQVLLARAQGLPIVYVTAWWQQFPVAVIADATLGLTSPADLKGETIALPGLFGANYIGLMALLYEFDLQESDVTLEAIGFNQVEAFATGKHRIIMGYITNEPIQLRAMGFDLTVFPVADYVVLASNGIITNESYLKENPERVRAFVNAFLMGLRDAIEHPDSAYTVSQQYVENLEDNDPIQYEVLTTAIRYWYSEDLGFAQPEAWTNMHDVLLKMGLLTSPVDIDQAFTNDYLPEWAKGWRE